MSDVCKVCGQTVEDPRELWREVVGWERPSRGAGGRSGSSLSLRERTGEVAHAACITRLLNGLNVKQEALL